MLEKGPQMRVFFVARLSAVADLGVPLRDALRLGGPVSRSGGERGPCGWLKDRFGVSWQVVPQRLTELIDGGSGERAQRVMAAMTCHQIHRPDEGWEPLVDYLARDGLLVSHGHCPDCAREALANWAGQPEPID